MIKPGRRDRARNLADHLRAGIATPRCSSPFRSDSSSAFWPFSTCSCSGWPAQRAEGSAARSGGRRRPIAAPRARTRRACTPPRPAWARRARDGSSRGLLVERAARPRVGHRLRPDDGATLGRGDVEIQLDDPFASSRHARITRKGTSCVIEDLGSTNGTYLNDEPLSGPQPLHPGDRIRIGDSEFSYLRRADAMLRAAETICKTDTGRQRRDNEDCAFARRRCSWSPTAWGARRPARSPRGSPSRPSSRGCRTAGTPEQRARRARAARPTSGSTSSRARGARARRDGHHADRGLSRRRGAWPSRMSATAAPTCFRDGDAQRLTQDHSLVDELVRRGKLTEEQAAEHPQRSIITRALGPEPEVEVDTWTYPVRRRRRAPALQRRPHLDALRGAGRRDPRAAPRPRAGGDELIADANAAGGRDNITVVLFAVRGRRRPEQPTRGDDGRGRRRRGSSTSDPDTADRRRGRATGPVPPPPRRCASAQRPPRARRSVATAPRDRRQAVGAGPASPSR